MPDSKASSPKDWSSSYLINLRVDENAPEANPLKFEDDFIEKCKTFQDGLSNLKDTLSKKWDNLCPSNSTKLSKRPNLRILTDMGGNIICSQGDQEKILGLQDIQQLNFFNLMADYNKRYFISQGIFSVNGKLMLSMNLQTKLL